MQPQGFEAKLAHAKEILEKLMNPEVTLEESVVFYEEGLRVLKEAQQLLEEAQLKIETIEQSMLGEKE
ncbi:MAG TPA: exodeoxyribonuclease VII small subunit [Epsilonproteobacteria bacterium]|nr:exodeoxyribonuclease VII small subunit [Campylobacterota bacterium]